MAYPIELTLGTGNKVSLNYQSQEVNVSLTYKLEREDTDVLAVVEDKADELVRAHALAWKRLKGGERPDPVKETNRGTDEAPVLENPQELECEDGEIQRQHRGPGATRAQVRLIHAMNRQAGLDEEELRDRIRDDYQGDNPEQLDRHDAAELLVDLGRKERERFAWERERSLQKREPGEETTS